MNMSWLIIMFFVNGQPIIMDSFPPKLVLTEICFEQQRKVVGLLTEAFPDTGGMAFCVPDNRKSEAPSVGA